MGSIFDKLMGMMHLAGDDYDQEYEDDEYYDDQDFDDFDEQPEPKATKKEKQKKAARKEKSTSNKSQQNTKSSFKGDYTKKTSSAPKREKKIVRMHNYNSEVSISEVCIFHPDSYDVGEEIIEVLLDNQAAIVDMTKIANTQLCLILQHFIYGGCKALSVNVAEIQTNIILLTPEGLEVTGSVNDFNTGDTDAYRNYV